MRLSTQGWQGCSQGHLGLAWCNTKRNDELNRELGPSLRLVRCWGEGRCCFDAMYGPLPPHARYRLRNWLLAEAGPSESCCPACCSTCMQPNLEPQAQRAPRAPVSSCQYCPLSPAAGRHSALPTAGRRRVCSNPSASINTARQQTNTSVAPVAVRTNVP